MENALEAQASLILVEVCEDRHKGCLQVVIQDDGRGMTREQVEGVFGPFFTTREERPVGLGLALWRQAAESCGGRVWVDSSPGKGTLVGAEFQLGHVDLPPMGDLAGTLAVFLGGSPQVDVVLSYTVDDRNWRFDTRQIRQVLGQVPLSHPPVIRWIREYCSENLARLGRSEEDD
ncbi:MAG: ATP-binding protein [Firmicutes bacterium]|nr:ATP-binding protein [Bacillota bacterium]